MPFSCSAIDGSGSSGFFVEAAAGGNGHRQAPAGNLATPNMGRPGNHLRPWRKGGAFKNIQMEMPASWEYLPEEVEFDFDKCIHSYWDTVTPGRLEFPGADGRGRTFVQTLTKRF